jgi:hypothetical protein
MSQSCIGFGEGKPSDLPPQKGREESRCNADNYGFTEWNYVSQV